MKVYNTQNYWVSGLCPSALWKETDPVSETLCFLVYGIRRMDEVQKPSNSGSIPFGESEAERTGRVSELYE
jgi:hypothetical protein